LAGDSREWHNASRRSISLYLSHPKDPHGMKKITGFLVAALVAASSGHAHGIWFAQRATQQALIYGLGADDLDSVKRLPMVQSTSGYDADWNPIPTKLRVAGPLLVADSESQPTVLTAVLFNGIWSRTPEGEWVKKGRDEVPNATTAEKNYKYAVAIVGPLTKPLAALPGQTLQIIPVGALPDVMEKPVKLRVLFQGKPVAGARVLRDWVNDPDAKPVKTGADGTVTIKVRNQGLNVVAAIFDGPSDEPTKADKMEHLATLSFVLPHAPE
jgi:nickel transport protein